MTQPFRIGIAGLGTVGGAVVKLLGDNGVLIADRAGRPIEIAAVSARSKSKKRGVNISAYPWVSNPAALAAYPGLDAVVELIGGDDGPALALVSQSLKAGRSVVTANKALLAHKGYELAAAAEKSGAALMYEAAVAGGIPIIKTLREGLAGNRVDVVYGILNGTCNYILTTMRETGRAFKDVLKEAQEKGYAEADPSFDIDGVDAAHKLCILSALAFGLKPDLKAMKIEGIRTITAQDIAYAQEFGYRIKLLGTSRCIKKKIFQSVEPCLVPAGSSIGSVEGVFNAVHVDGDFAGAGLSVGRGAGGGPTASAVVADIIDLARGHKINPFGIPAARLKKASFAGTDEVSSRFYMRLEVVDKPGVLADVSAVMRDHNLSIEAVMQRGRDPGKPVSIVLTTHTVRQSDMDKAAAVLAKLKTVIEKPCRMRIEQF